MLLLRLVAILASVAATTATTVFEPDDGGLNNETLRRIWRHPAKIAANAYKMTTAPPTTPPPPFSTAATYSPDFLAEANTYNITNRVVDIFFFTNYCGPSGRLAERVSMPGARQGRGPRVTYAELDVCCRQHDNCPNYITEVEHYAQYEGLERRNQYFARMQCSCDGLFYQCLSDLRSRYASAVAIGYGIVQSYCFEFEYPIVRCARRSLWRCEEYVVDASLPKRWQWFDVPPAYKKIFSIPQTQPANQTTTL